MCCGARKQKQQQQQRQQQKSMNSQQGPPNLGDIDQVSVKMKRERRLAREVRPVGIAFDLQNLTCHSHDRIRFATSLAYSTFSQLCPVQMRVATRVNRHNA